MKKIYRLLLIILIIPCLVNAKADTNEDINYEIEHMYISGTLDFIGSMHIEEAIVVKGNINKFTREIDYRDSTLPKWKAGKIDFEKSSFYNGRAMSLKRVSSMKIKEKDINFNVLNKFGGFTTDKPDDFKEVKTAKKGDTGKYTSTKNDNGEIITIYNPSKSDYTVYYLEYYIDQIAVLHNDVAEIYYRFIPKNFDAIKNLDIQLLAPGYTSKDKFKYYAHGSLDGTVAPINDSKDKENKNKYRGVIAKLSNINENAGVDVRMTFDKDLISVGDKILNNSKEDGLKNIEKVENERIKTSDKSRKINSGIYYTSLILSLIYLVVSIVLLMSTIRTFYIRKIRNSGNVDAITSIIYFVLGIILVAFSLYFKMDIYFINCVSLFISLIYLLLIIRVKESKK